MPVTEHDEALAIVQALAKAEPMYQRYTGGGTDDDVCIFCQATTRWRSDPNTGAEIVEEKPHRDDCLWVRAVQLVDTAKEMP